LRARELAAALDADPHLLAAILLDVRPAGRVALAAPQADVGEVDRAFLLDHAALRMLLAGLHVALDHVDALDHHAVLLVQKAQHLAALALPPAGPHAHLIPLPDVSVRHHKPSGASEMIFMNRRARSSRATGPKMRVPMGSLSLVMRTAEFSSNRM